MDMRERRTYTPASQVNLQNQAEGISETLVTLMTLFLRHFIVAFSQSYLMSGYMD